MSWDCNFTMDALKGRNPRAILDQLRAALLEREAAWYGCHPPDTEISSYTSWVCPQASNYLRDEIWNDPNRNPTTCAGMLFSYLHYLLGGYTYGGIEGEIYAPTYVNLSNLASDARFYDYFDGDSDRYRYSPYEMYSSWHSIMDGIEGFPVGTLVDSIADETSVSQVRVSLVAPPPPAGMVFFERERDILPWVDWRIPAATSTAKQIFIQSWNTRFEYSSVEKEGDGVFLLSGAAKSYFRGFPAETGVAAVYNYGTNSTNPRSQLIPYRKLNGVSATAVCHFLYNVINKLNAFLVVPKGSYGWVQNSTKSVSHSPFPSGSTEGEMFQAIADLFNAASFPDWENGASQVSHWCGALTMQRTRLKFYTKTSFGEYGYPDMESNVEAWFLSVFNGDHENNDYIGGDGEFSKLLEFTAGDSQSGYSAIINGNEIATVTGRNRGYTGIISASGFGDSRPLLVYKMNGLGGFEYGDW